VSAIYIANFSNDTMRRADFFVRFTELIPRAVELGFKKLGFRFLKT